ncbi:MAG: hypothetical protein J1F11_10345 [Oscillospiraceae bacterium]|nr:hypothetical protein [Oscillospiraceae bacterium]
MTKKPMNSLFLNYLIESENNIAANAEKWMKNYSSTDKISEMSKATDEHIVLIMACWGEIGWCLPEWKKQGIRLGKVLDDLKTNVSITKIDEGLSDCFAEREIEALTILIKRHLSNSEKRKLDLAFELYLKQAYFTSAVLLAGLIDSASINQVLKSSANPQNVSQCWKCYGKVIQENFGGAYFTGTFPFNKSAKNDDRGNSTIEFFKSIKHDICFDNKKEILIPLSFALLKFFDDSDWQDKKNGEIPSSINRHWLAHNMYDYDDITRADCIKLFCMLYQITELYSML